MALALMLLSGPFVLPQSQPVRDPRWAILVFGISGEPDLQKQYLKEMADLREELERWQAEYRAKRTRAAGKAGGGKQC